VDGVGAFDDPVGEPPEEQAASKATLRAAAQTARKIRI
jgi:hypothetical protein